MTQRSAATAESSAAASQELNAQAEDTMAALVTLERMLGVHVPSEGSREQKAVREHAHDLGHRAAA